MTKKERAKLDSAISLLQEGDRNGFRELLELAGADEEEQDSAQKQFNWWFVESRRVTEKKIEAAVKQFGEENPEVCNRKGGLLQGMKMTIKTDASAASIEKLRQEICGEKDE